MEKIKSLMLMMLMVFVGGMICSCGSDDDDDNGGGSATGTYTLSLAAPKGGTYAQEPIVLIDHETGTRTLITDGAYTFTASSGTHDSRFTLELGAVVTNVQHVAVAQQQTEPVFDLQGRRLAPAMLHKGLYIIGGKKHVVK